MTVIETDEDAAARWAIRLDAGALDAAQDRALQAWLAEKERRGGALLRAQAVLAYLDRGRALAAAGEDETGSEPPTVEADNADVSGSRWGLDRRMFLAGGALSGLAAIGTGGILHFVPASQRIRTEVGEVRRIPLADGSVAAINTDSKLAIAMKPSRRTVRIEDGEAWFQVAHDKKRPFIVEAGEVRVEAVGTAFLVRKREAGADVLVTEGVVETWVVGHEGSRRRIAAGARSFVTDTAPIEVVDASQDMDRALAWREGELALNGESLAFAVAELNRYNQRKLVVDDWQLAQEPLVGYFQTNDPESFGRAVAEMMGAQLIDEGSTLKLVRRGA